MGMAMREDHQITFAEQHRLVSPFHGEPARSSRDKMEARNLSARHEETPGCAHGSATIEGTVQVHRLEYVGKDIFLKICERFHRITS